MTAKALPLTDDWQTLARRIVWFEEPETALADPVRFAAHALARGVHEDMRQLRTHLSDDDLREVLVKAPPGIIDERSWAYWNNVLGRYPPPPQPQRFIP